MFKDCCNCGNVFDINMSNIRIEFTPIGYKSKIQEKIFTRCPCCGDTEEIKLSELPFTIKVEVISERIKEALK